MIKVEMTFANAEDLVAFMVGKTAVQTTPARLAAAGDAGIPAQEVKKGPGRPRKETTTALAPAPAAKPVVVVTPDPVVEEAVEPIETTFEDYKTFMTGAYTGGHRGIVLEVLAEYGAAKISGVPADKYDEVMAQVTKRVEEAS